jgi:hypothetical protein
MTTEKPNPVVTFHRVNPAAIPPMRGDKSGLGSLPTAAFQYCEAMRSASALGWYVFPITPISLRWDGSEVLHKNTAGRWEPLTNVFFDDEFNDYWDTYAPDDFKGWRIPYLSSLFVPGIVQVWSGLFVSTIEDWSIIVRPPVNTGPTSSYYCYEGLIETDQFKPCPLFVNIRLLATDHDILIPRERPLFQVQPIHRRMYDEATMTYIEFEGIRPRRDGVAGMSLSDWEGLRRTSRSVQAVRDADGFGGYGAQVRRRGKGDPA